MGTPREQLAQILRKARQEAGFESHIALARKMNVSRTVITKAENASQPIPSDAVLTSWSGMTGVPLDTVIDLAKRARSGTPEWFMPYIAAEGAAASLRCWGPLVIPGLLQTEAYARALLSVEPYSPDQLEELVATRLERQKVLHRAHVTAAIDNRVLRGCVGSAAIMAEQCAHLAALAESPLIALYVVPEGANVGTWGALDIATGPDGETVLCLNAYEDVTSTSPRLINSVTYSFERILGASLPLDRSIDFIREMEESWKSQI